MAGQIAGGFSVDGFEVVHVGRGEGVARSPRIFVFRVGRLIHPLSVLHDVVQSHIGRYTIQIVHANRAA